MSRAEFKIMEAFDAFGLGVPKVAVDIGAAPGGWSLFLAGKGAAVIAIDGAELDSERIRKAGVGIKTLDMDKEAEVIESVRPGTIVHLRCRALEAIGSLRGLQADMITNDINAGGIESSMAALEYAEIMGKGATLVMTVKCMRRNVGKYIGEVEGILESRFRIMRWKVLPHNRQEITLFAKKK
ncbi:MAG: SAM-dependent methyltransferase [Candidatus Micrarchaeaceae archaeon]